MESIFYSSQNQNALEKNGYLKIPFLSQGSIDELNSVYKKYLNDTNIETFTSCNIIGEHQWRKQLANEIQLILSPYLTGVFKNVNFWLPTFLIKPVGANTVFEPHQDWTFVDEEKYVSGNIWIPLCDTNEHNGTLYFIPKSHYKYIKSFRPTNTNYNLSGLQDVLRKYCIPIHVKAGEAVVFYHSCIHYSSPNISDNSRIAISCGFNSLNTKLAYYYLNEENRIEEFGMNNDFVFDFNSAEEINRRPKNGLFKNEFAIPVIKIVDKELESLIKFNQSL